MSLRLPARPERSTLRKLGIALLVLAVVAGAGCAGISDGGSNDTDVEEPGVNGSDANATDPGADASDSNGTDGDDGSDGTDSDTDDTESDTDDTDSDTDDSDSDTDDTDSDTDDSDSDENETETSLDGVSLIDHVPAEQNLVMHVDASISEDATTQEFLEASSEQAEEEPEETPDETPDDVDEEEFQQSLDEFQSSTGLDPLEFEDAIYFGQYDETPDSVESADVEEQFGLIANTGWTTAELTDAIESNESIEMTELDYQESGVYYELTNVENPEEDPLYLGMLGDGAYVIGVESTVEGSLDVAYADGDALSGTLRDAYDESDGYATFAMTVPEDFAENSTGTGSQIAQDLEVVAGTYYTEGDELGLETRLTMGEESTATDLSAMASLFKTEAEQSEDAPEALQHLEVEQDGSTVIFDYASDVETLIETADSA